MTVSYNALDNEFAISSGSNVNSGPGLSTFDYPPNSTMNFIVTSQPGDPTPTEFSVGDTYDVTWGGHGGGETLLDAVVIRSDPAPDGGTGGGLIVFEGTNDVGELIQVVWTPDFDLEGWYWANFTQGNSPGFHVVDQDPNYSHSYVCFAKGTLITTPKGQVPVETLRPGDAVMTRDHGLQILRWVGGKAACGIGKAAPVHFAPGALGNNRPLVLSQQHRLLVISSAADLHFGSSEVLVPAKALVNGTSVRIIPTGRVVYYHLLFDQHEILWAQGVPCESLLLASVSLKAVDPDAAAEEAALMPGIADRLRPGHAYAARPILTYREARIIADRLVLPGPALVVPEPAL